AVVIVSYHWSCHDMLCCLCFFFFFQAEDGIRDFHVTGVQTCALPISVSKDPTVLVFSSVGYQRNEVRVDSRNSLVVEMKPVITEMDEVVVVGYGTQRRSDLTGSVASVKAEQLNTAPIGQLSNALQGLASGLEIVAGGGSPAEE